MTISPNKWELDVQGYLNVCNITAATPRKQLRDFAYGVDELGLWNSMVCWPLRSSQNYGSGDTVFSLGGLGTFNGTRVNGPTWEVDGIDFDGTDDRITTSFNPAFSNVTVYGAANVTNKSARRTLFSQKVFGVGQGLAWFYATSSNFSTAEVYEAAGNFRGANAATATDGVFNHVGLFWDKSNLTSIRNAATTTVAASTAATQNAVIGAFLGGQAPMLGKIAMCAVFHNAGNVHSQIQSLYKSTLGTGLGLP